MEDIKTLLKEHAEEIKREIKRHMGVLGEDFDHKLQLIAESVSGIQPQLKAIAEMVAKNAEDIEVIKIEMMAMKSDMVEMKSDMVEMKSDMVAMQSDMVEMKSDMAAMQSDMMTIKSDIQIIKQNLKRKVDLEEFEALEKRVIFLEAKMRS